MTPISPFSAGLNRRDFILQAGASLAAVALAQSALAAAAAQPPATRVARGAASFPVCGLEKHFFEKYSVLETAQTYAEIGIDIELTLRPEGHIKPENAGDELPAMAAALARHNRRILIVASSFVRPDEPHLVSTLQTMKQLGIPCYRHRGFRYRAGVPLKEQIAGFRTMARDFAAINKEMGVQALYQNHAGADHVGAAIWDLDQILDDIDPQLFGVALDTRHLLVEQGRAWPTAVRLIAPRVGALFVKSFRWDRDRTIETPLRDGNVTAEMVNQIVGVRPALPLSIHVEHTKLEPVPFAQRAGIVGLFRDDAQVLRAWLGVA